MTLTEIIAIKIVLEKDGYTPEQILKRLEDIAKTAKELKN